jgi:hypothetical protein
MRLSRKEILFYALVLVVATLIKFYTGPNVQLSGLTAIFALAMFAGMQQQKPAQAVLLTLILVLGTDTLMHGLYLINLFPYRGFYGGQYVGYILFALISLLGVFIRKGSFGRMVAGIFSGPTLFFLVSNLMVWNGNGGLGYTNDLNGLLACYTAALPFYGKALLSTAILLPAFNYTYHLITTKKVAAAKAS